MEITIDGRSVDLDELDNVLQHGPIPRLIKASDRDKMMTFMLIDPSSRRYIVTSGRVPAYPGALARQNAMKASVVSKVVNAIKEKFNLNGGKRRRTMRRKSRRLRRK